MEVPKKIDNCPIVDSVVELRFESSIFPNAVFGLIFNSLQKDFPKVEKLPILQLPEQLRDSDPNFRFKAQYRLISDDGFSVQIGPDVLVMGSPMPYPGWSGYFEKIKLVIERVYQTGVIKKVIRLGVRFINFFDIDIFEQINLDITINNATHKPQNTQLRTELTKNGFLNTLNIANNAKQSIQNNKQRVGSIIDIDTFKEYRNEDFKKIYESEIENAHNSEKEIFFSLLREEYLKKFNPEY
ncbi:MAG: TIGR04255 family protein [Cyclobacteriaceae bacterium]